MIRNTIQEWLQSHPNVMGFVFIAGIYLSKALEVGSNSAGGGYAGP